MTTDRSAVSDLPLVLEDLARAVDLGEQLGLGEELAHARDVLTQASHRRRLAPQTTVAALLGATGSGKSSLTNAMAGSEVSRTARTRPYQAVCTGPTGYRYADRSVPLQCYSIIL